MKHALRILAAVIPMALTLFAASGEALRPPSVPLVAHDPYFSIWSPADKLTDADTVHWTGKPHRLTSLVRIDGKAFRLMGTSPTNVPALPQTGLEVTPTRTIYTFEGEGVRLTLTFMTPALPDDLDVMSRSVTYLTYACQSADKSTHNIDVYFDASGEIAVNEGTQAVRVWSDVSWGGRQKNAAAVGSAISSLDQRILAKKGDDLRIDWGHLYVVTPRSNGGASGCFSRGTNQFEMFAFDPSKMLKATYDENDKPLSSPAVSVVAAALLRFPTVGTNADSRWIMLAYDDGYSIRYMGTNLRSYAKTRGWTMEEFGFSTSTTTANSYSSTNRYGCTTALIGIGVRSYESLVERCTAFDAELMADLRKVGGEEYAQLCALAYRQTFAGNKIVADANGKPLMFPKENFSNGCIGTVDVLFPQAPFFLALSPALTKAMLVPILDYAASPRWPYGYAPHDLGTYPHATGQVYGMSGGDGGRMPVEECGNMLIMLAALAKQQGNAELAKPYWPMLTKWADYLVENGLDPTNQLCSADMFGHLPRNANLALKAVIGIGAFGQLSELAGKSDEAKKYRAIARDFAAKWQELAKGEGRTVLAYGQPGTWSMKHNLIWDRILAGSRGRESAQTPPATKNAPTNVSYTQLFPDSLGDAEVAWYLKVQKPFGLPVDSRTDTCLIDWAVWSIALARSEADFQKLFAPLYRYANETPNRVPLGDWFVTTTGAHKAMQARPVVGGIFMKLVADPAMWQKWSQRGADVKGPWAPIPIPGPSREVVPTAQKQPVMWRYTTNQPPADWFQPGFDDSSWAQGPAGFGTKGTPGAVIRTEWNTKQIWLRRQFTLANASLKNPRLQLIYDEDPEIYINGVLAAKPAGWSTAYDEADLSPAALATLKPGANVLAVRCQQTYGGQSIDVGLIEDAPPSPAQKPSE